MSHCRLNQSYDVLRPPARNPLRKLDGRGIFSRFNFGEEVAAAHRQDMTYNLLNS